MKLAIVLLYTLALFGIYIIVWGTGATPRYISPPHILPGVLVLHFSAFVFAVCAARIEHPWLYHFKLWICSINQQGSDNLKRMFFIVFFSIIIFSLTKSPPPVGRYVFFKNYEFSLFLNILTACISAAGLFGWVGFSMFKRKGK